MKQNKLYVGNFPYTTTEAELRGVFSDYGEIEEILVITDRHTGQSRGFGFVTFASQQAAESALALNGTELGGRRLVVNVAREREGGGRQDRRR